MSFTTLSWHGHWQPAALHLIRRPKLSNPLAWHYGMAVEYAPGFGAVVYDLVQGRGFQYQSLHEFLEGRRGEVLQSTQSRTEVEAAWARVGQVLTAPGLHRYHVTARNCEHVARYIVNGRRQSLQVEGVFLGVAAGVLVFALTRKSG